VTYTPGNQSLSIVNALYTGMAFGELLNAGVQMSTWFMPTGGGCFSGNMSASLYGWQNVGSYDQVSDGWPASYGCGASMSVPAGTILPSGYAEKLAAGFATPGDNMLAVTVNTSVTNVKAYAASQGSGYALMLFNLDQTATTTVTLGVTNASKSSFTAGTMTYGKTQYDDSKNNVWTAPLSASLGTVTNGSASVTLPPWSMTVVTLQ
jgi:hypothetical protein